jgi:pimeloyl-ACP methyl ester carboxylesterase
MKQMGRWMTALLMLVAHALHAQDIAGTWQGTLGTGPQAARLVLQLAREGDGRLSASLFNLDQGGFGSPATAFSATLDGNALKATFPRGSYDGVLGANGAAITGTWTANTAGMMGPPPPGPQPLVFARPTEATVWRDSSAHRVRFVAVERDVRLEVLDWGGSGRPVILLTGAGDNAHVFDQLAPKLTNRYHVYAITRRGFAPSSIPTSGYLADSLADDVLAVVDSLRIERPVLVGHSIAGQELSSIGSRRPDRVAGLVYLEAGHPYALYDPSIDNTNIVIPDALRKLAVIGDRWASISLAERAAMIRELADTTLPVLTRDLRLWAENLDKARNATVRPTGVQRPLVASALFYGAQKYTRVHGPVLAIYAAPRPLPRALASDSVASAKADSASLADIMPQVTAFQRGVPQARVVRLAHASHYVFRSNEADVLREVRAFIDALPARP